MVDQPPGRSAYAASGSNIPASSASSGPSSSSSSIWPSSTREAIRWKLAPTSISAASSKAARCRCGCCAQQSAARPSGGVVVPRFLALMLVTGLFDIYALLFGIFGGVLATLVNSSSAATTGSRPAAVRSASASPPPNRWSSTSCPCTSSGCSARSCSGVRTRAPRSGADQPRFDARPGSGARSRVSI